MYKSIRFRARAWRHEVLSSLQRADLPVLVQRFKGHTVARSRTFIYYGGLLFAAAYVVSMLQFNLYPGAYYRGPGGGSRGGSAGGLPGGMGPVLDLADPAFTACHRGLQYAPAGETLAVGGGPAALATYLPGASQGPAAIPPSPAAAAGASGDVASRMWQPSPASGAAAAGGAGADGAIGGKGKQKRAGPAPSEGQSPLVQHQFYHFQGLRVPAVPMPEGRYEPRRGIVVTASGRIAGQAIGAYVTAYILRKVLGCTLPIEVFFVGPRETFGARLHAKLRELGDVRILSLPGVLRRDEFFQGDLRHLHVADRRLRSYAAKPYAVYAASFEEVLLFDAGVVPFLDPAVFFEDFAGYRDHGFHLFRDYRDLDRKAWGAFMPREFCADVEELHAALGGTEADSSCVLVHKARAWDALLVTMAMNGPLQPFTYARLNGDKDTWALAAALTRHNFSTSGTTPGYFMEEADVGLTLVDAAYTGRAQPLRGHVQFRRSASAPGGVEPLYLNNQLLNMTEYPRVRDRLAFGLWEDYGYPFCGWRAVNPALRPPPRVLQVLDAVAAALDEVGAPDECLCKWFRCRYPDPGWFLR